MLDLYIDQEHKNGLVETTILDSLINPVSVLVVDDHALVRAAISQVLTSRP